MMNRAQERIAAMADTIARVARQYTFATERIAPGRFVLLCKVKGELEYGYVASEKDCKTLRFKSKASAHNAAEKIHDNGLEESGFILTATPNLP